jgi:hypothetical protein
MPTILEALLFATEKRYFHGHCIQYLFCSYEAEKNMIENSGGRGMMQQHNTIIIMIIMVLFHPIMRDGIGFKD